MEASKTKQPSAEELRTQFLAFLADAAPEENLAVDPGHRKPFVWPTHPVSYNYHLLASDWRGSATVKMHGETFELVTATTPQGVFGRCEAIWHEARGETFEEMAANLKKSSEPLFKRQFAIGGCLRQKARFTGTIRDLAFGDLLKLLYCSDRDVASEAMTVIELHASQGDFLLALLEVLLDRRHPLRRSAQWCVLDLFEDLSAFCRRPGDEDAALSAIKSLIWDAPDDYARTIYKAGVVLGGHLPGKRGGPILVECLHAPSPIGRRSAIHGLFHVVEWDPSSRGIVVKALRSAAKADPEPPLRVYAARMADDIEAARFDHGSEPVFAFERQ